MKRITHLLIILFIAGSLAAQIPVYNNNDPGDPNNPDVGLVNSPGTGAGGSDESVLQNVSLGMFILGYGHQIAAFGFSIADDFVLAAPTDISQAKFYAYQTGSSTTSTITGIYVRIWDGVPGATGSNIVFGDLTTNRLANTQWTNIYRVTETSMGNTSRPIMEVVADLDVSLAAGTYYIEWGCEGSNSFSGPWAPPITISGQVNTGDGLQSLNGSSYNPVTDAGEGQGFPFILYTEKAIPTLGEWGLIILGLSFLIVGVVAIRYRRRNTAIA